MKISHPVRSAVNKHRIDRLVLQWVTMWESRLLNSFALPLFYYYSAFFFFFAFRPQPSVVHARGLPKFLLLRRNAVRVEVEDILLLPWKWWGGFLGVSELGGFMAPSHNKVS